MAIHLPSRLAAISAVLLGCLAVSACGQRGADEQESVGLDAAAEKYLELALALSVHDPLFVVSYYGPTEARETAQAGSRALPEIGEQARRVAAAIGIHEQDEPAIVARRRAALRAQLMSVAVRADLLAGERLPFRQEAELVFGAPVPDLDARQYITALHAKIDRIMPGTGLLADRIADFRKNFIIPRDRLPAVIEAAVQECRRRTLAVLDLTNERLEIEFASGVNWLTFNEYRGNGFSVIKINTDLPVHIDRAVEMGCHEGYPGHHVSNVLKERELVDKRGWREFTIQTLYSPETLVEEGTASYGVELVFPFEERIEFERDVIFELAGFDRAQAHRYLELKALLDELAYADIEAARRYLDGEWDAGFTSQWLVNYRLLSPERARQRLAVFDTYRSFVAAGYLGRKLVREYVLRKAGAGGSDAQWREFRGLLTNPVLPSDLRN